MKTIITILLACFLIGCAPEHKTGQANQTSITGTLVNVTPTTEDGVFQAVWVEFSDGTIIKLRVKYDNPIIFRKGQINEITFEKDNGLIKSISIQK